VFADIVVLTLGVQPLEPFETGIWQIFLIFGPADAFILQEIDEGGDVSGDLPEAVVVHAEVVAADGGDVIGLAGMGDAVIVG